MAEQKENSFVDKLAKIAVGRRNNVTCITDSAPGGAPSSAVMVHAKNIGGISGQLTRQIKNQT